MCLNTYKAALCLCVICLLSTAALAQSADRAQLISEIASLHNQIKAKEAELLAPPAEDKTAFADFLKQPETGLIRLLPREKYDGNLLIKGGGAYYSFARLSQEYGYGSDISLEQGRLTVGFAGAGFGFLLMLGDVPLETVTLETAGVPFLAKFPAPSKEAEAREYQQMGAGMSLNGFTYRSSVPALVDRAYIVRSIDYRDSDTLVAFRVVRQDADGSQIILWKMLKKFPVPQFAA